MKYQEIDPENRKLTSEYETCVNLYETPDYLAHKGLGHESEKQM